jgi:hypothetical protein
VQNENLLQENDKHTILKMESELEACGFGLEHAWKNMDLWVDGYIYHLDSWTC